MATITHRSGYTAVERDGPATEADSVLPDGVTVFDDRYPGVFHLDPELLEALRDAGTPATRDGVELYGSSGWRSPAYQNQLLREAVATYGSEREAARWVATAETSPHVSGKAVDIKGAEATTWLSRHGGAYGLCQIYRNEPWHYERRRRPTELGRPVTYADPTHDPRMQPSYPGKHSQPVTDPTSTGMLDLQIPRSTPSGSPSPSTSQRCRPYCSSRIPFAEWRCRRVEPVRPGDAPRTPGCPHRP